MIEKTAIILGRIAIADVDWNLLGTRLLIFAVGAAAVTWGGGAVIGRIIKPYSDQLSTTNIQRGFSDGGKVIGLLERLLIYLFVLSDQWTGVGFLITAKSVFRFGELKDHENRLEAEYITIGTLMSFTWGIAVSLLTKSVLEILVS